MSKADEMFEKLGYVKDKEMENMYCMIINSSKKQKNISFDDVAKDFVTVCSTKYDEYGNLIINQIVLSIKELQAMNEKVKELGWNE